ncbi:SDR family oxidoreductase [Paramicrobacterium chengjingii]|uniref:SDR family oxidoreductase n=1 Tax=Paramicrobacterium chengjingii TaxID=2769067 RepID=A0ABX6YHQ8_9MICO|nr:SDR family oxidoreductase [Microbacterium chengjingii]QPZ38134.1 SDR family oxidoreductase [Microbacterium chengjingii]
MVAIEHAVAVVTGANRGLGREFARQLMERGARVYAGARDPGSVDLEGVEPLQLDITRPEQAAEAARVASTASILINNAGVSTLARVSDGSLDDIRREMEVNYFGTLNMVRAFAPVLAANGGGAMLNVSSVMAWLALDHSNSYGASKAAVWALSNGLRVELADAGTQVSSMFMASTDTDMMSAFDIPKHRPEDIVRVALDRFAAGELEILADDTAEGLKEALSQDRGVHAA